MPTRITAKLENGRAISGYPRILVSPPGPNAKRIIAQDEAWSSPSYIKLYPLVVARGKGAMIEDVDGNRFIDFMAGIAVASTGYSHPQVVDAVQQAAAKFFHICGTDFYYEGMSRLCERLAKLAPGKSKKRVFLTNSGTEAVEGAVKLARSHTKRPYLISFHGAFHGRSYAAISLTTSKVKYRAGFGPLLPGVFHLPFDNPYHNDADAPIKAAHEFFHTQASPNEIAAVVMEPILGEGGYVIPRPEFIQFWRKFCDEHGILLIFDEIQSGIGRTGKWFAAEHFGVEPDVILSAKGLGSGMPIGAIIAKESVMTWPRASHGSTFGGNPVCCAAALATLDVIEKQLLANSRVMGARLMQGLKKLQDKYSCIGNLRGLGLMIGVEFVKDRKSREPAEKLVHDLEQLAFKKGLLLLSCGKSTIRVAPPLIVNEYDVDTGLKILDDCLKQLTKQTARGLNPRSFGPTRS